MQRALDVSNYSGVFDGETVACWRERGYEHLICGTQRPEITRRQLETALAGGMTVEAYVYLYWRRSVVDEVRRALETVRGLPVERLWLDCEDAPDGLLAHEIVALIREAAAACGELPHGVYTGRWWWTPNTADSDAFSHLPLWHAEYTSGPEQAPDFTSFRPYGGWTRPAMWQFQGTTLLCGVGVDLNLREAQPVATPEEDRREALNDGERWELEVLRAGRRFEQALHNGRFAFRPAVGRGDAVELVRVEAGRWVEFQPPCVLMVE